MSASEKCIFANVWQVIKMSKEKEMKKVQLKTFVGCEHCGGKTKIETKERQWHARHFPFLNDHSYQSFEARKRKKINK